MYASAATFKTHQKSGIHLVWELPKKIKDLEIRGAGNMLGGEQSGHTIFSDYSTTGDGMLTALMVLAVMCRKQKPLSELAAPFVTFPQKLINIKVATKPPLESISALSSAISQKEKELGASGRILVRYSGTENKVRVMVECEDEESCRKHATDLAAILEKEIGAV